MPFTNTNYFSDEPDDNIVSVATDETIEVHLNKNKYYCLSNGTIEEQFFSSNSAALVSTPISHCAVVILRHQPTQRYWMLHISPSVAKVGRTEMGFGPSKQIFSDLTKTSLNNNVNLGLNKKDKIDVLIIERKKVGLVFDDQLISELEKHLTICSIKKINGDSYGGEHDNYKVCFLPNQEQCYIKYDKHLFAKNISQGFNKKPYSPQWRQIQQENKDILNEKETKTMIEYFNKQHEQGNSLSIFPYEKVSAITYNGEKELIEITLKSLRTDHRLNKIKLEDYEELKKRAKEEIKDGETEEKLIFKYLNMEGENMGIQIYKDCGIVDICYAVKVEKDIVNMELKDYYQHVAKMKGISAKEEIPYSNTNCCVLI